MYTLDLDRLNLRSPYYIWKVKDGVYAFDTDAGVSYEIGLSVNTEMLQMEVCAFDINNKSSKPSMSPACLSVSIWRWRGWDASRPVHSTMCCTAIRTSSTRWCPA